MIALGVNFPNIYGVHSVESLNFNFNYALPKVSTDYIRQTHVLNIDTLT